MRTESRVIVFLLALLIRSRRAVDEAVGGLTDTLAGCSGCPMALNLVKLCVGADSIEDLREWVARKALAAIAAGQQPHSFHTTRMVPKRTEELLADGSLYWVIKGYVQARQPLIGVETFTDGGGIGRCNLILGPEVVETELQPRRAFQGWRYLDAKEAPRDLTALAAGGSEMPLELRRELAELGLL